MSLRPQSLDNLTSLAEAGGVPLVLLGETTQGSRLVIDGLVDVPLQELDHAWTGGLATVAQA